METSSDRSDTDIDNGGLGSSTYGTNMIMIGSILYEMVGSMRFERTISASWRRRHHQLDREPFLIY